MKKYNARRLSRQGVEIWKPVPEYDRYEVSNLGRVRSVPRRIRTHRGNTVYYRAAGGKIMKPTANRDGHFVVQLYTASFGRLFFVHQLVLTAFVGPCPKRQHSRHLDDIKSNNRLYNLKYGTPAQNGADKVRNGNSLRGVKNHNTKLTVSQVREIKKAFRLGATTPPLSKKYGVSTGTLASIRNGTTWDWVQ